MSIAHVASHSCVLMAMMLCYLARLCTCSLAPSACCVQAAERCSKVKPASKAVLCVSGGGLSRATQLQSLSAALPLLSHLQPHISEVVLTYFTMNNALAEVLTAAVTAEQGWGGVRLSPCDRAHMANRHSQYSTHSPPSTTARTQLRSVSWQRPNKFHVGPAAADMP